MTRYKLRVRAKQKDDGSIGWRVEMWQHWNGWIDALQGWFNTEEEAYNRTKKMNGLMTQEKLL